MNYAGLIYDDSTHYLDHLGPLCSLLNWPLILCEPVLADLARAYYPDLEVIEKDLWNLTLPPCVAACVSQPLLQAAFPNQTCKLLWLPHGNSDKQSVFKDLGAVAFVYGQQMADRIHSTPILRVGNFRWEYYLKYRTFYQNKVKLPQVEKLLLYAPTWEDSENNGSFWQAFPHLARRVSTDYNLLVKLHPNTLQRFAGQLETVIGRIPKNVHFLPDVPPIYPILDRCSAYIGDMSSIGYDFLTFDRPMYFLNAKPHLPLHACGWAIEPDTFCLKKDPFSKMRKTTYRHTFDKTPNWVEVKQQLMGPGHCFNIPNMIQ